MGSSGSRPIAPMQATGNSRGKKKKMDGILAPFLRSMNCGASSLERTQSFAQQERMEYAASQDAKEKCMTSNLSDESGIACGSQGPLEETDHNQFSGDNNSANQHNFEASSGVQTDKSEAHNLGADGSSDFVLHRCIKGKKSQQDVKRFSEHQALHIKTRTTKEEASVSDVNACNTLLTRKQNDLEPSTSECFSGPSAVEKSLSTYTLDGSSSTYRSESEVVSSSILRGELDTEPINANSVVHDYDNIRRSHIEGIPSSGEASGREHRRNNRSRLWESLTNARRRRLSSTFGDASGTGSWNSSWGLFGWDSSEEINFGEERSLFLRRNTEMDERRWRSRQQLLDLENIDEALQGGTGHSRYCAFGRHPNGHCACEAFATAEETSTRASISRIVMLAEALFEVLDEIHRQSVALSRSTAISMVSSPAPETIVDSFPVRIHKKNKKSESTTSNCDECYICLIEYVDGDQVRTLPCSHEFHMTCVDKWLKEIHRVCPLCRGNVCNRNLSNSLSTSA